MRRSKNDHSGREKSKTQPYSNITSCTTQYFSEYTPAPSQSEPQYSVQYSEWSSGKVLLDDYLVEKTLGRGGSGNVYLVRRLKDNKYFAVKTLLSLHLADAKMRRMLLRELRTWIDLPEYPHFNACRFFRTVENRLTIFAEYVDGGALSEWIRSRRLVRIGDILDIAIQIAWGLNAAHKLGIIHQDIKPSNILMTQDKTAKITDFGLSKAPREISEGMESVESKGSNLVSSRGGTWAYSSPEQILGRKVGPKTDMWAWGVTVLEMFIGRVQWVLGSMAPEVLKRYWKHRKATPYAPMPEQLYEVLRRCFIGKPDRRWPDMKHIADMLIEIYWNETGLRYLRKPPEISRQEVPLIVSGNKSGFPGANWDDPVDWLKRAMRLAGRDLSELPTMIPNRKGSRRSRALADLEIYEEAQKLFLELSKKGRPELDEELARLFVQKAKVHAMVNDLPGAFAMHDRSIEIIAHRFYQDGRVELADELAVICQDRAKLLWHHGKYKKALNLFNKLLEIRKYLEQSEMGPDSIDKLSTAYMNKAIAVGALGNRREALEWFDKCIHLKEKILQDIQSPGIQGSLAIAYMNKAVTLNSLCSYASALDYYNRAVTITEKLVSENSSPVTENSLSTILSNKAITLFAMRDYASAAQLIEKALKIKQRLVHAEGWTETQHELALVQAVKADIVGAQGNHLLQMELYESAIGILDRLVSQEGRGELEKELPGLYVKQCSALKYLGKRKRIPALIAKARRIAERLTLKDDRKELQEVLARVYLAQANTLRDSGLADKVGDLYDKAISIRENLVFEEDLPEVENDLAWTYMNKANFLRNTGDYSNALNFYKKALAIRERLVYSHGRHELESDLAWVYLNQADTFNRKGDISNAGILFNKVIEIMERLVFMEGRKEMEPDLAWAYQKKANSLKNQDAHRYALDYFDKALAIQERQSTKRAYGEITGDIAVTRLFRSESLLALGQIRKAAPEIKKSVKTLEMEIMRTGRVDYWNVLTWAKLTFKEYLHGNKQ